MAVSETIQEILEGIDTSQYGRDMRQYIHKGIEKCYEEGSAGETDLEARTRLDDIEANLAPKESTSTASQAYAVGDYLRDGVGLHLLERSVYVERRVDAESQQDDYPREQEDAEALALLFFRFFYSCVFHGCPPILQENR